MQSKIKILIIVCTLLLGILKICPSEIELEVPPARLKTVADIPLFCYRKVIHLSKQPARVQSDLPVDAGKNKSLRVSDDQTGPIVSLVHTNACKFLLAGRCAPISYTSGTFASRKEKINELTIGLSGAHELPTTTELLLAYHDVIYRLNLGWKCIHPDNYPDIVKNNQLAGRHVFTKKQVLVDEGTLISVLLKKFNYDLETSYCLEHEQHIYLIICTNDALCRIKTTFSFWN